MPKPLRVILKIVGVLSSLLLVGGLVSGNELAPHLGTVILAVASSVFLFFSPSLAVRLKALALLVLVVVVSRAVDYYFWVGVWEHGYPWPYSASAVGQGGFIGSIAPFIYQVSVVSFFLLGVVTIAGVVWHLTRRSRGRAASGAPLS